MRQIVQNLAVKIRVVHCKVGPLALCIRSESFVKASHWPPFKSLARVIPFLCLWQGGSSDVSVASSSPDHGDVAPQSGKWHCHFIPKEGMGSANVVGQGFAGAGSPIVMDSLGRWPKGQSKTCSPLVIGRGTLVPHGLPGADLSSCPTEG